MMSGEAIEPWTDLVAQQAMLEREAADLAASGGQGAGAKGGGAQRDAASAILRHHLDPLEARIARFVKEGMAEREIRRPVAAGLLDEFGDPAAAAFVTLRLALASCAGTGALTALAAKIGGRLDDERRTRRLRRVERRLFDHLQKQARPLSSYKARRAVFLRAAQRAEAEHPEAGRPDTGRNGERAASAGFARWSLRDRTLLGVKLLEMAVESTGLFEIELAKSRIGGRNVSQRVITATAELTSSLANAARRAALLKAERLPMVCPPEPWAGLRGGGYLTAQTPPLNLVKIRSGAHLTELEAMRSDTVYSAINAAQGAAWRVNRKVLELQKMCLDGGLSLGGLPPLKAARRPAPLPKERADDKQAVRSYRRAMRLWLEEERRRRSRVLAISLAHQTAARFRKFERLWLPHQYDFRGRLYPVTRLSPHSADPVRALLEFAEGRPLGEEGWKWLAIHLANCGDFEKISKAPLADRVRWVFRNEERIRAVAADPLAEDFWREADKPWQFLAACFEWSAYVDLIEAEGEENANRRFHSHLPVALDGACSGLQHFSLMLRDEVGGAAVNLSAKQEPKDLYTEVAERLRSRLREDLSSEAEIRVGGEMLAVRDLAGAWLRFGVGRELVKRPTMTYGYGARSFGYADQIIADALAARRAEAVAGRAEWPFPGDDLVGPATFLAGRVARAIEETVVKAAEAMNWLQGLAGESARRDLPLRWTTPDGFVVLQAYRETKRRLVHTTLSGQVLRLTLREEGERIDRRRQRQGVAPNVIHSLDACHLRLTVAQAHQEGMRSFALVHDSFGVHAADTPRFFQIIREAVVALYEGTDVPQALGRDLAAGLPEDARRAHPPPPSGALALEEVLEAEFAFA